MGFFLGFDARRVAAEIPDIFQLLFGWAVQELADECMGFAFRLDAFGIAAEAGYGGFLCVR